MFRVADMGDNLEEMVETEACKVLQPRSEGGDGLMTIYRVVDGVYLMYNDFHMARCAGRFASAARSSQRTSEFSRVALSRADHRMFSG